MTLKIKLDEPNYESIIKAAIPLLKEKTETSDNKGMKFAANFLKSSGDIPVKMLSLIPQEKKDEIVIFLINHYKENIKNSLQNALREHDFDLNIADMEIYND